VRASPIEISAGPDGHELRVGRAITLTASRPYQTGQEELADPILTLVAFRIVSRGFNLETLHKTIESVRESMRAKRLFPYLIEVVTDGDGEVPSYGDDLRHIVVPQHYQTQNGTLFKARALNYPLEHTELPDTGWVMHLDEETCVTPRSSPHATAIEEEERSGRHRIGAGLILYHHSLDEHPLLTLAESMRSGDDIARVQLQQRLGFPRVRVARLGATHSRLRCQGGRVDFGPGGSITEDAYLALIQMQKGRRVRWIDGHVVEQCTFTLRDYLRQRRRWFVGIAKTAIHAPERFRYRAIMASGMLIWALSWASVSYSGSAIVAGLAAPWPVILLADFTLATYVILYLIGLKLNLEGNGNVRPLRRLRLYATQVALIPRFSLMESAAVAYGLLSPDPGFHVVQK
jgi:egghead protein (zeste-white 4 protein)